MVQVGFPVVYIDFGIYKIFVNLLDCHKILYVYLQRGRSICCIKMKSMGQVGGSYEQLKSENFTTKMHYGVKALTLKQITYV